MSVYNNQEIKPMLPSLNYSQEPKLPMVKPVMPVKPTPQNLLYSVPSINMFGTSGTSYQTALPPLQFYSGVNKMSPDQVNLQGYYNQYPGTYGANHPMIASTPSPLINNITTPEGNRSSSTSSTPVNDSTKHQQDHDNHSQVNDNTSQDERNLSIDYSSIINYTISPSLKRKRRSSSLNSSKVHKETEREVLPKLPCDICGKIFNKPYNLKSHMRSHSTEKPFSCSVCNKKFARSHDKKRHELLHKGEKNFKCEGFLKDGITKWGCGKKFARSDALSRHFRTETGWLCIKPLMDEAKQVESNDLINSLVHE